jgi:hypothetical protein
MGENSKNIKQDQVKVLSWDKKSNREVADPAAGFVPDPFAAPAAPLIAPPWVGGEISTDPYAIPSTPPLSRQEQLAQEKFNLLMQETVAVARKILGELEGGGIAQKSPSASSGDIDPPGESLWERLTQEEN